MGERKELQNKLDLIDQLQVRLENREDGFQHFYSEESPKEEIDIPPDELESEELSSLKRLTDFFCGFSADEIYAFPEIRRQQFITLLDRAIRLLEDARHYDTVDDLARDKFTDKANFIQAADEIYEDIPQELFELKRETEEKRLEPQG